jgi:hypothetical protein
MLTMLRRRQTQTAHGLQAAYTNMNRQSIRTNAMLKIRRIHTLYIRARPAKILPYE